MKKSWIIALIIIGSFVVLLILGGIGISFYVASTYNSIIEKNELVDKHWADVENVYQRRADLIPNLVATVKGYAEHEQETLEEVINARAKATSTTINADNLTSDKIAAFQQAQDGLSSALSKLMVVVEKYPDLKANTNFLELQAQLEGTENRIAVERRKFNEAARSYNTYIKKFPKNLVANNYNFESKPYFKAQEGAETAPKVEF